MTSLYGIRTTDGLVIVDVAAGRKLHAPFTVNPAGQPGWQPAALELDALQGDPVRPVDGDDVLEEIAFRGGVLRHGEDHDGDLTLWCVPLRACEYDPIHADLILAGGFVFARDDAISFSRLQPDDANARVPNMRAVLDRYAEDGPVLAFEAPRRFLLAHCGSGDLEEYRQDPDEEESVTLFVTASGAVHAITEGGDWSKITSRAHPMPAAFGSWHRALVVAVPPSVIDAAGTVEDAIRHPHARAGIDQVILGDCLYLRTRAQWTLTTPIVRILAGIFVDRIGSNAPYLIAGPDAAWIVEDSTLLPVHDGDILPAPAFLAVGDRIGTTVITYVVRLDDDTAPTTTE